MESDKLFAHWHQQQHHGEVSMSEMGSTFEQLHHPNLLHLNWEQSMDQSSHFESALSSMVSSPSNPTPQAGDSMVIHELIGRLGNICNSGEISPQSHLHYNHSNVASCYTTPLNSPPKLNLSMMVRTHFAQRALPITDSIDPFTAADPRFAEGAAQFAAFGARNYGQGLVQEPGKLSRVASSKSMMASRPSTPEERREEESVSGADAVRESNGRKRKAAQKGKGISLVKDLPKVVEEGDANGKKSKSSEGVVGKGKGEMKLKEDASADADCEYGDERPTKEKASKLPEPPKQDFIHVRARRGQATDSHSLAERVRREKISERMKFLQNLVPGCDKVTGKAMMLDEIINYVQSLQRQVEFLSMKLATLNPHSDFNMDGLLQKDVLSQCQPMPHSPFPIEAHIPPVPFPFPLQPSHGSSLQSIGTNGVDRRCNVNPMDTTLRPSFDVIGDAVPQVGTMWEDDFNSFVQMSHGQNQEMPFSSQYYHGSSPATHMKVEP